MDSYYNLVSNANMNEEPNSGLFDFNNEFGSPDQFLTPFSTMNQFLDSPSFIFNSNIIPSPTTGNYSGYDFEERKTNLSDLVSRSRTNPIANSRNKMEESMKSEILDWNEKSQSKQIDFSMEVSKIEQELIQSSHEDCKFDPIQASNKQSKFEDGYNWRKYGQKQVKGSNKPRSYFKCSYPNCPTKKKVEKDLNGYITEIIYKGKHNHPVPQNMKKSSLNSLQNAIFDYSSDKNRFESFSRNSTASFGEAEYDQDSSFSESSNDRENEPNAKRWKIDETESEGMSYVGSKTVQEPRVVIETKSEIDILDDGYKWRKYGQKVVKGNPNPRNYYKCTNIGCPVRKLVERAAHDLHSVITTYEGKHNHNVPSRASNSYSYARNELPKSTSNNYMSETSMPLANYSYNVHGMRGLTIDNGQTHISQHLEKSKDFGLMGNTYTNQDWVTQKFVSKTKEEPENDFIYHSF